MYFNYHQFYSDISYIHGHGLQFNGANKTMIIPKGVAIWYYCPEFCSLAVIPGVNQGCIDVTHIQKLVDTKKLENMPDRRHEGQFVQEMSIMMIGKNNAYYIKGGISGSGGFFHKTKQNKIFDRQKSSETVYLSSLLHLYGQLHYQTGRTYLIIITACRPLAQRKQIIKKDNKNEPYLNTVWNMNSKKMGIVSMKINNKNQVHYRLERNPSYGQIEYPLSYTLPLYTLNRGSNKKSKTKSKSTSKTKSPTKSKTKSSTTSSTKSKTTLVRRAPVYNWGTVEPIR